MQIDCAVPRSYYVAEVGLDVLLGHHHLEAELVALDRASYPMIKRIRDAERALRKKLVSNGNEENEETEELRKKIEELRETKKTHGRDLRERKLAKKYHMVKFVERQKLVRKISKCLFTLSLS